MSEYVPGTDFVYGYRKEWLTEEEALQVVHAFERMFDVTFSEEKVKDWAGLLQHESQSSLEIQLRAVKELARNWTGKKPPYFGNLSDEIDDAVREWKATHQPPIEPVPVRTEQEMKELHEMLERKRAELRANRDEHGPARP